MHWFWRGTIAVAVGGMLGGYYGYSLWNSQVFRQHLLDPAWNLIVRPSVPVPLGVTIFNAVFYHAPPVVVGLGTYAALGLVFRRRTPDNETLCRKCGYILRGITEPRCPECGERI